MSLATLESRLNASVIKHLANAECMLSGQTVRGVLKRELIDTEGGIGMAVMKTTVQIEATAVPDEPIGQSINVNDTPYAIADVLPDSSGLTKLILELT